MKILFLAILTVLPGSWITFGLPLEGLKGTTRFVLGVALSPVVLAIQFFILRIIGIDFAIVAPILVVANLPSIFLLIRSLHWSWPRRLSQTLIFATILFLILAGSVMVPWLTIPGYRVFSWHGLLHTDVIYGLTRMTLWPEEPELAGLTLAYDWIGAIYWGILGWLSNWAPTSMYLATNLIWLLVTFILAYESAKVGLGLHDSTALLGVGLLFFGTQAIGSIAWLVVGDIHRWSWFLGDVRNTALVMAFQGFEDMPFAIGIVLGITLVCLVSMQQRIAHLGVIIGVLMISIALIYPILYPMACLLVGGTLFLLASKWAKGIPNYSSSELGLFVASYVISVVIFIVFLLVVSEDRTIPSFQILQSGRWSKSFQVLSSLFLFLLFAIPLVPKSFINRWGPGMVLTLTGFCLIVLYIFVGLHDLESKLINVATIPFALLSAGGLESLIQKLPRARWKLTLAAFIALAMVHLFYAYHLGAGVPPNLSNAPRISEESFWIALAPSEDDAAWTKAVREYTPRNTIVIVRKPGIHLAPFIARSLYFPSDYDEASMIEYKVSPAGYSVDKRHTLLGQRGYAEKIWNERLKVIDSLYKESDPSVLAALLEDLERFDRPFVIHFSSETIPTLTWLRREKIGFELFSDGRNILWFIDQRTLQSAVPIR